jgi:hypothetical protein
MCARLSEDWQADRGRPRRAGIIAPVLWYTAIAAGLVGMFLVFACAFLVLFRWGGVGSLPIVAIELGSIGFVAFISGVGGWVAATRRRRRERPQGQ